MPPFLAAAVQLSSRDDKRANLAAATRWAELAARRGATLIALPELFNCLGHKQAMLDQAEEIPGATSDAMSNLARRLGVTLVAGSICERSSTEGRAYNSCLVFDGDGKLAAKYRKMHLFDVDLPQQSYCESSWLLPGDSVVTADTAVGRLGLAICYDLRFPELFRRLIDAGAEVLLVPSAFTLATGRDHWQVLLRARSIESQAYVVAPNQYGQHTTSFTSYGHSMIVDPWGTPLAVAPDGEGLIVAEIDLDRQQEIRRRLPALAHRRLG